MHVSCSHIDHIRLGPSQDDTEDEILERARAIAKILDSAIAKLQEFEHYMNLEGAD